MAMQAKVLMMLVVAIAAGGADPLLAGDRPGQRPDRGGWDRRNNPSIYIEPELDLNRPRPNTDTPEFVMAELQRCTSFGVQSLVDCLRDNHSSVMIRRLEACVNSETIPDDLRRVMPCLPMGGMPPGASVEGQ